MELDILATVRGSLMRALEEGKTFREWKKGIADVLDKSGWTNYNGGATLSRFRTIYQTNMRVARSAGQWDRIQRTKKRRPFLVYRLGPSEHHRAQHVLWDGTLPPADDAWWDTHFVPNGFGCKCWIRQVSGRQAEALGGVTARPSSRKIRHVNAKTGAVEFTPIGIDPGWDYNAGKNRTAGITG